MTRWLLLGAGLFSIQACGWCIQWACRSRDRRVTPAERWGTSWLVGLGMVALLTFAWMVSGGSASAWAFRTFGTAAVVAAGSALTVRRVWYVHAPIPARHKWLIAAVAVVFLATLPRCATVPTAARNVPPSWLLHLPDSDRVGTDDVTPLAQWYAQPDRFPHPLLLPMAHTYLYVWMGRVDPGAVAVVVPLTWLAMLALMHAKVRRHAGDRVGVLAVLLGIVHLIVVVVPSARVGTGDDLIVASLLSSGVVYLWSWMHSAKVGDSRLGALLLGLVVLSDASGPIAAGTVVTGLVLYRLLSRRLHVGLQIGRVALFCALTGAVWLAHRHGVSGTHLRLAAPVRATTRADVSCRATGLGWGCAALVGAVLALSVFWRRQRLRRPRNLFLCWVASGYPGAVYAMGAVLQPGAGGIDNMFGPQALVRIMPCAILLVCSLHEQPTGADPGPT